MAGLAGNDFMRDLVSGRGTGEADPQAAREKAAKSSGQALPDDARAKMEPVLGADLSDVKVHTDDAAAAASREVNAKAYTQGTDIYFSKDAYDPASSEGAELLAHEVAHVASEHSSAGAATSVSNPGESSEQQADALAQAITHGGDDDAPVEGGGTRAVGNKLMRDPGDGEEQELTPEEIEEETRKAQADGNSKPEPEIVPGEVAEETPVEGEVPAEEEAAVEGEGVAEASEIAATAPSPEGFLTAMADEKLGTLVDWDSELGWHDHFAQSGVSMEGLEIDRGALVLDALGGGMGEGLLNGLKGLAIDTAINVGSSKIPYLSGFVEMARLAYDPVQWFEGVSQATVGKMAIGWDQITSGDPISVLEGLLNILDGINGVIGTVSNILWIVAAAGFLLSFVCPACLPFVGLCAQWAMTLGGIGTLVGIYITMGRLMIMGLRSLQILFGDADPQETLEQAERLRAQSSSFTSEFTARAGHSLRSRASNALNTRSRGEGGDSTPPRQRQQPTEAPPSRMSRAVGLMTGAWGGGNQVAGGSDRSGSGRWGGGLQEAHASTSQSLSTAREVTQAYRGQGRYSDQGPRSTRQQLSDMEEAGGQVFHSQRQRERVDKKLGDAGEDAPTRRALQEARLRDAELVEADQVQRGKTERAQEELRRRRAALADAEEAVRRAQQEHGDVIAAKQREVAERRALRDSYGDDVRAAQTEHDLALTRLSVAQRRRALLGADRTQGEVEAANQAVTRTEQRLEGARQGHQEAELLLADGQRQLTEARQPVVQAEQGQQEARDATIKAAVTAGVEQNRANQTGVARVEGRSNLREQRQYQPEDPHEGYTWYTDFAGNGPTGLHGHNQASGALGAGVDLVDNVAGNIGAQGEAAESGAPERGGPAGLWRRTSEAWNGDEGRGLDWKGSAGARGGSENYAGQAQQRMGEMEALLLSRTPPRENEDVVDGTRMAYEEADLEERQIEFQRQVMEQLLAEGQAELTALDAIESIRAANTEALASHQEQLDSKVEAQQTLQTEAQDNEATAREGEAEGQNGQNELGDFMGGFMRLMGIVPSSLVSGGGGASGARQIDRGVSGQAETSGQAADAAAGAGTRGEEMEAATTTARADADVVGSEFDTMGAALQADELEAMDGVTFIQQTMSTSESNLEEIRGEKQRLREQHDGAIAGMAEWTGWHKTNRQAGLAGLDGIVSMAEEAPE